MLDNLSAPEFDDRIAVPRDNIHQLIEQAAVKSGTGDNGRASERIATPPAEPEKLLEWREAIRKH
jgi:hypothetical protein